MAIGEFIAENEQAPAARSVSSSPMSLPLVAPRPSTRTSASPRQHPDRDYYRESSALGAGTVYILPREAALFGYSPFCTLFTPIVGAATSLRMSLLVPTFSLWAIILASYPIDRVRAAKGATWRVGG
ncbi:hypothetical protein BDW68DRAFT_179953 [Aspergillus falconensis]